MLGKSDQKHRQQRRDRRIIAFCRNTGCSLHVLGEAVRRLRHVVPADVTGLTSSKPYFNALRGPRWAALQEARCPHCNRDTTRHAFYVNVTEGSVLVRCFLCWPRAKKRKDRAEKRTRNEQSREEESRSVKKRRRAKSLEREKESSELLEKMDEEEKEVEEKEVEEGDERDGAYTLVGNIIFDSFSSPLRQLLADASAAIDEAPDPWI